MKRYIIIAAILFFVNAYSQYFQGQITLNDKTKFVGLIKITNGHDVKFKENEDAEVFEYKKSDIFEFEFTRKDILEKYIYSNTTELSNLNGTSSFLKLLRVIINDKVSLYEHSSNNNLSNTTAYFIKRDGDRLPIFYMAYGYLYRQKFIPFCSEYFKDCPTLTEKVKTKEFKVDDYERVVRFYNENCK